VKLLVKMMVVFTTLYAVAALMRQGRISWPFAFIGTALTTLLGSAGDRILMPKMKRTTAVLTDIPLIAGSLATARLLAGNKREGVDLPYLGVVSGVLGGFEALYHEWVHDRGRYHRLEELEGGNHH